MCPVQLAREYRSSGRAGHTPNPFRRFCFLMSHAEEGQYQEALPGIASSVRLDSRRPDEKVRANHQKSRLTFRETDFDEALLLRRSH